MENSQQVFFSLSGDLGSNLNTFSDEKKEFPIFRNKNALSRSLCIRVHVLATISCGSSV